MCQISVSVVLYHTDENELSKLLDIITQSKFKIKIFFIDNSANDYLKKFSELWDVEYIFNNKNLGYGAAHNIAIRKTKSDYHLILNSDIDFDPSIIEAGFKYMEANRDVTMISPKIYSFDGVLQYYSRKSPTPFDLIARRFIPTFLKPLVQKRLDDFILLHSDYSVTKNIPNLPGCFMFIRTNTLKEIEGFDERFFMYNEDIDLTRRLHQKGKTLFFPEISIKHALARGSFKFSKLMFYHVQSSIAYFNKWGWVFDIERTEINKRVF